MFWPIGVRVGLGLDPTLTRHNRYGTFGRAWLLAQLPLGLDGLLQLQDLLLDLVQDPLQTMTHNAH